MKRSSTAAVDRIQIFKEHQLTIALDIGDRTSHCCILNEAGEVILESKLSTMPKESRRFSAEFGAVVPRWKPGHIRLKLSGS